MNPETTRNGLALYRFGSGPLIFLMPYPHASSYRSTADGRYAELLVNNGFTIITFDPPSFARSDRPSKSDLKEMFDTTKECLEYFQVKDRIPFTGHSMGGFCTLAMAIEYPGITSGIIISGSPSGWNDVFKYSIHRKWKPWQKKFWQSRYWGARIILNKANLETHRKLDNLTNYECFHDKSFFEELSIEPGDKRRPAPPRAIWLRNVRNYNYSNRLNEIEVPVLIMSGRYDPLIPVKVSRAMKDKIPNAQLEVFEKSGHSPFIEEPLQYSEILLSFLSDLQPHKGYNF